MRHILLLLIFLQPASTLANVPKEAVFAMSVNRWVQAEIKATPRLFDFAIQGYGFFVLLEADGKHLFTRNGRFIANDKGLIVHSLSRLPLLDIKQRPINVAKLVRKLSVKAYHVEDSGIFSAIFDDGTEQEIATVGLALFTNPFDLIHVRPHFFRPSKNQVAYYYPPSVGPSGRLLASSLEELDEELYEANGYSLLPYLSAEH